MSQWLSKDAQTAVSIFAKYFDTAEIDQNGHCLLSFDSDKRLRMCQLGQHPTEAQLYENAKRICLIYKELREAGVVLSVEK